MTKIKVDKKLNKIYKGYFGILTKKPTYRL